MSKINNTIAISFAILFISNSIQAQQNNQSDSTPFHFEASYVSDVVHNFSGGIKTGTTYLGLANMKLGFDTEKVGWWKGGQAFINAGNTHGGQPSATLVGDFQGVSNIEAGNLTFMYELWYKQSIGKMNITLGLQDLNANFAVSEYGGLFTNSSFGIHSSIADNIPTPIFPLTALGVNFQYSPSDAFTFQLAAFDGTPDDFENNPNNLNWRLNQDDGFLLVGELQFNKSLLANKNASYKLGVYYHQHNDTINQEQQNDGFYFVGDQQLTNKLAIFSQIGISPKKFNTNNRYLSLGLNYKDIFNNRPDDLFGLAVNYAGIDGNIVGSETAVEMTYHYQLCQNIYLRPDLQYVINPSGTVNKLKNALVGFLRIGISL